MGLLIKDCLTLVFNKVLPDNDGSLTPLKAPVSLDFFLKRPDFFLFLFDLELFIFAMVPLVLLHHQLVLELGQVNLPCRGVSHRLHKEMVSVTARYVIDILILAHLAPILGLASQELLTLDDESFKGLCIICGEIREHRLVLVQSLL